MKHAKILIAGKINLSLYSIKKSNIKLVKLRNAYVLSSIERTEGNMAQCNPLRLPGLYR